MKSFYDAITFEEMQNALGVASRATTFRYLKQVLFIASLRGENVGTGYVDFHIILEQI